MEYWSIETGPDSEPGIDGGLHKRELDSLVVNTVEVADLELVIEQIEQLGGTIVQKTQIHGVGWVAQFDDPAAQIGELLSEPV